MGNRAVITSSLDLGTNTKELGGRKDKIGIYLHWNGGRDSVQAFLTYCKLKEYRTPTEDESYAFARLAQVIGNFFGGSTSVGIGVLHYLDCDNYDNGVYIVGDNWEIVGREYFDGEEQNSYELKESLITIDKAQPQGEQLGEEKIESFLKGQNNV